MHSGHGTQGGTDLPQKGQAHIGVVAGFQPRNGRLRGMRLAGQLRLGQVGLDAEPDNLFGQIELVLEGIVRLFEFWILQFLLQDVLIGFRLRHFLIRSENRR